MSKSDFPPLSRRRKLLIVGLAIATAFTVVSLLLDPPGGVRRQHIQRVDRPACAASQTDNCVGGQTDVIVVPSAATASRPS